MAASTAGSMQREIDALKQALRERDEEVGQCHKRIRALTSSALPPRRVQERRKNSLHFSHRPITSTHKHNHTNTHTHTQVN